MKKELESLRGAAGQGDWSECHVLLKALLRQLEASEVMSFALHQVGLRLSAIERHHPDDRWARTRLESIGRLGDSVSKTDAPPEYEGPGANNFAKAVELLAEMAATEDLDERSSLGASAIANAIMAGIVEGWGTRNPVLWKRWYEAARFGDALGSSALAVLPAMMSEASVQEVGRQAWLQVADEVDRRLQDRGHRLKYERLECPSELELALYLRQAKQGDMDPLRRAVPGLVFMKDPARALELYCELAEHEDVWVAGSALIGLSELVRTRRVDCVERVKTIVEAVSSRRAELGGRAQSALEDIQLRVDSDSGQKK